MGVDDRPHDRSEGRGAGLRLLRSSLLLSLAIGLTWGAAEASVALVTGGGDPLTILLFHPLLAAAAGTAIMAAVWWKDARKALSFTAGAVTALAVALPLAVWINVRFVQTTPLASATNVLILVGSVTAALAPASAAARIARRHAPRLLTPRSARAETLLWALPLGLVLAGCLRCALAFATDRPGPWPDNRQRLAGKPNVVLVVLDTVRADHLSCYGHSRRTTPNLDALPACRFTRSYAQAHWTVPSTATLLTGLHPSTHQTNRVASVLPRRARTLTQILGREGFVTGYFSANLAVAPPFGFTRSADHVVWERDLPAYRLFPSSVGRIVARKAGDLDRADRLNRWVIPFLDSVKDRRFFVYVHYKDPHHPYAPPAPHDEAYDPGFRGRRIVDPTNRALWPISEAERDNMIARYDGELAYLDAQVGRVLDELRRLAILDETLVIITADHGEEFQDHGGWIHAETVYEEVIRVPLLISWPPLGREARVIEAPVGLVDIVPTVLDVVGLRIPSSVQGRSLLPLLRGEEQGGERALLVEGTSTGHTALLRGRHKLIRQHRAGVTWYALYDLVRDPGEREDLSAERPDLVASLRAELEAQEERYRAAILDPREAELDELQKTRLRQMGYIE